MFGGMKLGPEGGQLTNELYRMNMQAGGSVHWSKETAAGRVPPPTWRHTANEFDSTKILIFGGFTGEVERTNEVWVLNMEHMTWSRPVASSSALKGEEGGAHPSPRGSHSSCVVDTDLVVFGGYGGNGFARADFQDLYALSLSNWQWRAVEAHGTAPEPRSGHTANVIMGRWMFVVGGW
jgi:dynein heavy chain